MHKKVQENERKVVCPICGKVFPVRFYNASNITYSVYCNNCKKMSVVNTSEHIEEVSRTSEETR